MLIKEIIHKPIVGDITYDYILRQRLGDNYETEIVKILELSIEDFLDYFDNMD